MQYTNKTLLIEIQKKRETMIDLAQKKGLTNDDTIKCSQELDQLIYRYQVSFRKNKLQRDEVKNKIKHMVIWSKKPINS